MKKLLVILLLLFPVHGAWGETLFFSCKSEIESHFGSGIGYKEYKSNVIFDLIFDLAKSIVVNENFHRVAYLDVNDIKYSWVHDWPYIKTFNAHASANNMVNMTDSYGSLNRRSGIFSDTSKFVDGTTRNTTGKCTKVSSEKKF